MPQSPGTTVDYSKFSAQGCAVRECLTGFFGKVFAADLVTRKVSTISRAYSQVTTILNALEFESVTI